MGVIAPRWILSLVGRVSMKIWSEAPNNSMQRTALRVAADAESSASALLRDPVV
jgi:hypothetical protein